MKLAEALLLRKDLAAKVARMDKIDPQNAFELRVQRVKVTDSIDDVRAGVPKISMQQFQHAYNWHARALRLVDAAIQQANWTVEVPGIDEYAAEYIDPYVKEGEVS